MEWCVYVGQKAKLNYKIGFDNGVWGQKSIFKSSRLREIQEGDTVYFFHDIKRLTPPEGNEKEGNLRIKLVDYARLGGFAREVKVCKVTKGFYENTSSIWPDDVYPYRYDFEEIQTMKDVPVGIEFQGDEVVKNLLKSILTKCDAVPIGDAAVDFNGEYLPIQASELASEALEGKPIYKLHLLRERDKTLIAKKKKLASDAGKLFCEACGFDFQKVYGELGEGFIECHHNNPLAERKTNEKTSPSDLTLLCSNCHRMIHRTKKWLTVEQLKRLIEHE